MDKLQLYIAISLNGYKNMLDINPDEEVRKHVKDISDAIENITYDTSEKNIFYLLKSTDKGVFLVVIRTIPDKATDYLASWIFIPYDIEIRDSEIEEVVDNVRRAVSKSKITGDDVAALRKLFGKQYEPIANPGATVENYGSVYGHRFFGGDTGYLLSDYIGNKRYQTSYLQFAGVILADKNSVTRIAGPDLTDDPLDQMVKIFPPKTDDRPYRPLIYNHPFTQPFLVPLMGTIEIVWESSSAADIRQSIMISKPNMRPDNISLQSTRPAVSRPAITIERSEPARTTTPSVATPSKPASSSFEIETDKEENTKPAENHNEQRTVSYDRQRVYQFEIPAKSADISGMIRFEIHTRNQLTGSPIDGYELSDAIQEGTTRSNHLIYAPTENIQTKAIWGVVGFVVGILITLLCTLAFGGSSDSEEPVEGTPTDSVELLQTPSDTPSQPEAQQPAAKTDDQAKPAEKPAGGNIEAAVKYLDENKIWEKSKLNSYPDLQGLYDDMNSLNKQRLIDVWGPKLKDSRKFQKVVEHCKKGIKKKNAGNKTVFNTGSDEKISVQTYLNTIDP